MVLRFSKAVVILAKESEIDLSAIFVNLSAVDEALLAHSHNLRRDKCYIFADKNHSSE